MRQPVAWVHLLILVVHRLDCGSGSKECIDLHDARARTVSCRTPGSVMRACGCADRQCRIQQQTSAAAADRIIYRFNSNASNSNNDNDCQGRTF